MVRGSEEADAQSAVRPRICLAVVGLVLGVATAAWSWWGLPDATVAARALTAGFCLLIALTAAIDRVVLVRRSMRR